MLSPIDTSSFYLSHPCYVLSEVIVVPDIRGRVIELAAPISLVPLGVYLFVPASPIVAPAKHYQWIYGGKACPCDLHPRVFSAYALNCRWGHLFSETGGTQTECGFSMVSNP